MGKWRGSGFFVLFVLAIAGIFCSHFQKLIMFLGISKLESLGIFLSIIWIGVSSTIGFHLLWHTVELAMSTRLCLL